MAWIESHQSLLNHRKTGRLARALSVSKVTAVGHLHAFWWWCMDNAPTGVLAGIDPEDIADGAAWEGEPKAFIDALVYAGFVDSAPGDECVHDWMDYAGKLIEKREKDAERKRLARQSDPSAPSPTAPQPIQRTSSGHPADGAGTVPYRTVPNPTAPNRTKKDASHEALAARPAPRTAPKPPTPFANPLWGALIGGIGIAPQTADERSRYGKAVKALKDIATPEDVLARCANYRASWPDMDLTPEALVKHWSRMEHPPSVRPLAGRGTSGQRETTEEYNKRTEREAIGDGSDDIPGVIDAAWRAH